MIKQLGLTLLAIYTLFTTTIFIISHEYTYSALYFIVGSCLWFKLKGKVYR